MKVCFVGVGSIAKRHIRNLTSVCKDYGISLTIDAISRGGKIKDDLIVPYINSIFSSADELNEVYDAVFITNPTELHISTLEKMSQYGKNFFIEKPFASLSQLEKAKLFKCKENSIYYVACPLRYNAVIQYIKNNVDLKTVFSVRSISSSYLPDWRPNQDYRDTYSAHKDLGGGVSIDLIHEWDYLTFLFGNPNTVKSFIGKKSNLEIDSDDYAVYIAEYDNLIVELHLDYFGRKTIREIMIFTDNDTITGDIVNNKITFLKTGKQIQFSEERDDYQKRELKYFIDLINNPKNKNENCGIQNAIRLLEISQGKV